jgi:c(7)-type cytochrome triheme protein
MTTRKVLSMLAAAALAGAAGAADLPNLPRALKLPQSPDSPGIVTFNHDMHVDFQKPACVSCHPARFGILGRSLQGKRAPITHASMEKGASCGGCHDGKKAFNFEDCTMCHAM